MSLTARQLALATLDRQLLLERRRIDVADAVRRVCALQAQTPASPYLALWNRVRDFAPEDLDAAFVDGRIVKASLMRITLHAVHAEDYAHQHAAMLNTLRASRLYDHRFTSTGLVPADADALVPELARFLARPRTGAEVEDEITARFGEHAHRVWWALRTYAPVRHAPAAWSVGVHTAPHLPGLLGSPRCSVAGCAGGDPAAPARLPAGVRSGLGTGLRTVHPADAPRDHPGTARAR